MIGLGELMPHGQGYRLSDIQLLAPLIEVVRHYQLIVLSHCSEPIGHIYPGKGNVSLSDIVAFLSAFPDVRFVAAHWGGGLPFYTLMPEIQRITTRVWDDTAATIYLYRRAIFPIEAGKSCAGPRLHFNGCGVPSTLGLVRHRTLIAVSTASCSQILPGPAHNSLLSSD